MSSTDFYQNRPAVKSLFAAAVSGVALKVIYKEKVNWVQTGTFATTVGLGVLASSTIEANYPQSFGGTTQSQFFARLATDLSLTGAGVYATSMVAKQYMPEMGLGLVGIVAVADVLGDMMSHWVAGDINLLYDSSVA
jgi:hypothetical protein